MLLKAVGSEKAKISISSSESVLANLSLLLPKVRKIGRYERAERKIIEAIREKRLLLDDLERALQVVLDSEEGDVKT